MLEKASQWLPPAPARPLRLPAGQDGVAARARARASLAEIAGQWDEVDTAIDDLNGRVDQLLADHTGPDDSAAADTGL